MAEAFFFRGTACHDGSSGGEYGQSFAQLTIGCLSFQGSQLLRLSLLWGSKSPLIAGSGSPSTGETLCRMYLTLSLGLFEPFFVLLALLISNATYRFVLCRSPRGRGGGLDSVAGSSHVGACADSKSPEGQLLWHAGVERWQPDRGSA
jgi:hypothetical protein